MRSYKPLLRPSHQHVECRYSFSLLFSAQVQAASVQDVEPGREAAEEHQLPQQSEEAAGARHVQQRGEGDQDVHQGPRSQLSLSRFRR